MKTGTDLWYNAGEEEVTMKLTLLRTIKCSDEGRRQTVSETTETQLKRRRM